MSTRFPPPSPPVVGGTPRNHSGTGNMPITRVVIHSAVVPCEAGRARQLGEWNRDGTTGGSWHYATDPGATVQCSWDRFVCWHAPPNPRSIGIEMADMPSWLPGRWVKPNQLAMLRRTARLTAELCLANDLPPYFLSVAELKAGKRGVTSHNNVSLAFGESTHTDPRLWPRRMFMRWVRSEVRKLRNAAA